MVAETTNIMDAVIKKTANDTERGESAERPTRAEAEAAVETLLRWIGEDPSREGLVDTPRRVATAYYELFSGYGVSAEDILGRTFEEVAGYEELVLIRDIPFFSHCEHHLVPIIGKAHVGYLPDKRVVGLSKIARVVDMYARRLQTQEAMTAQVAEAIDTHLKPLGVAIVLEAEHMCMAMRGIRIMGSTTMTSTFTGVFNEDANQQMRFMSMLRAAG
jgi:GTP cyclohydrolase IA